MSNGLEREFPELTWPAVPPIGPRGMQSETVRDYIAYGRELHSRAIRDSVRFGLDAIARALLTTIMTCRLGGRDPDTRPSERESWAGSGHGA